MENKPLTMEELQDKLCTRASNQIEAMFGTLTAEQEALLHDFFEDGVDALRDWLHLKTDSFILKGNANRAIVQYIVRSFNALGIEGQRVSNVGGDAKTFDMSPLEELRASFTQRV